MGTRGESEDVCLRHGGLNGCDLKPAKRQSDTPVVKTKNTEALSSSHLPEKSNNCEAETKELSGYEREQHQPALINAEDNF